MLGGNEFRLRRGFGLRPKHSYGANAPPRHAETNPSCCTVSGYRPGIDSLDTA